MTIRIVNLRTYKPIPDEILFKVDRSTKLGNPFYMHNESERDEVCDKYEKWFWENYNEPFYDYLSEIAYAACTKDIALGCWCYPKRCHAETIKAHLEWYLERVVIPTK